MVGNAPNKKFSKYTFILGEYPPSTLFSWDSVLPLRFRRTFRPIDTDLNERQFPQNQKWWIILQLLFPPLKIFLESIINVRTILRLIRMMDGQFPPNFLNWSEWPTDNFLLNFKICQYGLWTISYCFPTLVRFAHRQFTPIFKN